MISGIANAQSTPAPPQDTASGTSSAASADQTMVTEQTFLQLLVAQLQNQDPMQPQDGAQLVAQLAQFSSLEQEVQMRQDLDNIKSTLAIPTAVTQGTTQS